MIINNAMFFRFRAVPLIEPTCTKATSAIGLTFRHWWNNGITSSICTVLARLDPSLFPLSSTPLTAQCGYLAACRIILVYARDEILYSAIFRCSFARHNQSKSNGSIRTLANGSKLIEISHRIFTTRWLSRLIDWHFDIIYVCIMRVFVYACVVTWSVKCMRAPSSENLW